MDWIFSTIAKIGSILGPIGITIVVIIFALSVVFKFSRISHFELSSKLFTFSIAKEKRKPKEADKDEAE